jgi:hypothetical protein
MRGELPTWDREDKARERHDRREERGLDVIEFIANSGRDAVPKYKKRPGTGRAKAKKTESAQTSSS